MRYYCRTSPTQLCLRNLDPLKTIPFPRPPTALGFASWLSSLPPWAHRGCATEAVKTQQSADHNSVSLPSLVDDGNAPLKTPYQQQNLERELFWLKDPLKLADHTARLLDKKDYHKALALVRSASKDVDCTVSWNHLVDYDMAMGKVTAAVKTYNEVCVNIPIVLANAHLTRLLHR